MRNRPEKIMEAAMAIVTILARKTRGKRTTTRRRG